MSVVPTFLQAHFSTIAHCGHLKHECCLVQSKIAIQFFHLTPQRNEKNTIINKNVYLLFSQCTWKTYLSRQKNWLPTQHSQRGGMAREESQVKRTPLLPFFFGLTFVISLSTHSYNNANRKKKTWMNKKGKKKKIWITWFRWMYLGTRFWKKLKVRLILMQVIIM